MNGNGQQVSGGKAMVDAQDVHKYFHGNEVLKGINMQVAKGEVVVLIGASGSGKTTFLRCVNHLEKIDKGRIYVDGELIGYQVTSGGKVVEAARGGFVMDRDHMGQGAVASELSFHGRQVHLLCPG